MKHKVLLAPAVRQAADAQQDSNADADAELERITARPDGYYWQTPDGRQEFGPFESLELAQADRDASDADDLGPGEMLQEVEQELGIASWIDPETGEPANGQSRPRLEE
ncbi:MAG: hypothetical protein KJ614_05555 [Gammaproteobacteria bacterium]|uniref:hypothetical protein n=1 Tax=Rhodoferax sp. TaxID=50421 RepID=UPI00184BCFB6|nr:hypothetical protein [Rhodoferax sp.]MBU3898384.1 hypothetical protein [Gammaproteobacteria bacterium]MBA3059351.1 hypothetical protein [Rhodoferax sp.]MBU3998103.1 hypothetical protein [Gammaproteobacteria bacterium]MBU4079158.1 hypothetical protein [Gammaproteobacteria bacterium]MBU4113777.1 hypothetical protein [Gammaproteobacteria bacterium]